ncbi:hypothetical protein G7Y89_g5191 [Cudoniella acicularis]|uniref:Uncharacterized protein n=1 Tax=Cudoniella acicularis TaxID=354080 RepID=A0A8H4RMZ1_9HELO|nr:hypothetical protein G7Y89_g5191 [Cudoniella acicularis]
MPAFAPVARPVLLTCGVTDVVVEAGNCVEVLGVLIEAAELVVGSEMVELARVVVLVGLVEGSEVVDTAVLVDTAALMELLKVVVAAAEPEVELRAAAHSA